jgi:hypothetical protein
MYLYTDRISSDGMRTINPMETIKESPTRSKSNQMLHLVPGTNTSRTHTPLPSPGKQKHYYQNLLSGMRSPLNLSKSTMDGIPFGSQSGRFHINSVNETLPPKAHSYIEHWLHHTEDGTNVLRPGSLNPGDLLHRSNIGDQLSRRPSLTPHTAPDNDSLIFNIDIADGEVGDVQKAPTVDLGLTLDQISRAEALQTPCTQNFTDSTPKVIQNLPTTFTEPLTEPANQEPVDSVDTKHDRSRHTSSSDGSISYRMNTSTGMATVSSLTPLLKEMENLHKQSKI